MLLNSYSVINISTSRISTKVKLNQKPSIYSVIKKNTLKDKLNYPYHSKLINFNSNDGVK